jgi:hypothetical protein
MNKLERVLAAWTEFQMICTEVGLRGSMTLLPAAGAAEPVPAEFRIGPRRLSLYTDYAPIESWEIADRLSVQRTIADSPERLPAGVPDGAAR